MENYLISTYTLYLVISIALTVWVARTLHRHGRIFLIDAFSGNAPLADSVNHMLVVGFYLINIGYVSLALEHGRHPKSVSELMETLGTRMGAVLLVLGAMHFFNLYVFSRIRRRNAIKTGEAHLMGRTLDQACVD